MAEDFSELITYLDEKFIKVDKRFDISEDRLDKYVGFKSVICAFLIG